MRSRIDALALGDPMPDVPVEAEAEPAIDGDGLDDTHALGEAAAGRSAIAVRRASAPSEEALPRVRARKVRLHHRLELAGREDPRLQAPARGSCALQSWVVCASAGGWRAGRGGQDAHRREGRRERWEGGKACHAILTCGSLDRVQELAVWQANHGERRERGWCLSLSPSLSPLCSFLVFEALSRLRAGKG